MNKKGFTLIELLAVIVVLGIIMTVASTAVLKQKRKANTEEAKKIEQTLADLGPGIYSYEKNSSDSNFMDYYKKSSPFKISDEQLKEAGYLTEKIKNPAGNGNCTGYLIVNYKDDEMFKGYVNCSNLYKTELDNKIDDIDNYEGVLKNSYNQ